MPLVAVAGGLRLDGSVAIVHHQVQRGGAVATSGVGGDVGSRVGAGGVEVAVPLVAVAGGLRLDGSVAVVHRQVQRYGAVATSDVGGDIGRSVGAGGVDGTVPCEGVAGGGHGVGRGAVVHRQVQRGGAVAARGVGGDIGRSVGAGGVEGAVPLVAIAGGLRLDGGVAAVHRQVQRYGAVAALDSGESTHRCGGRSDIGDAVLPSEAVACHLGVDMVVNGIHLEGECNDGVAAHDSVQRVDIGVLCGQHTRSEGVAIALADGLAERGGSSEVLLNLVEDEALLEGEARDVGGAHADGVLAAAVAVVAATGNQTTVDDGEQSVVGIAVAIHQLVGERQGDVVVDGGETTDDGGDRSVFAEAGGSEEDIGRGCVVVDDRVGRGLQRLAVAHVVDRHGGEAVEDAVDQGEAQGAVGRSGGVVLVTAFVLRDIEFDMVDSRTALLVGYGEGEEAHTRVGRDGLQRRRRSFGVEGVLPSVGGDGCIVVEDDGGVHGHGVARVASRTGGDEEADVALAAAQRIVDGQEAHLRAGGFEARGGVDALEYPEELVVHHVDTGGDIHPDAQRSAHVEALGIGGGACGHREDVLAEAEVGQAETDNILTLGHRIGDRHACGGSGGEVGVVFEANGVVHFFGGGHEAQLLIIALGALDFVRVLRAFHPLQVDFLLAVGHAACCVDDAAAQHVASRAGDGVSTVGPAVGVGRRAAESRSVAFDRGDDADTGVADATDMDA